MHRSPLVVATFLVLALAGCSDAPSAPPEEEFQLDLEATQTTGIIRGVVVDAAITPITDARVALTGGPETRTDDAGQFGFTALDPGTYFLEVTKPGYGAVQQGVEVVAGVDDPPIVKVLVERIPGTEPFVTTLSFDGYIGCAAKVTLLVQDNVCGLAVDVDSDENQVLDFGTTRVPDLLQTEVVWEATQEIGKSLGSIQYVEDADGARQRVGNVWGASPLICTVTKTSDCTNADGTGGGGDGLNETGFPGHYFASVYAACYPDCLYGAIGFGAVLQQRYTLFSTAFFNFVPEEGWTLVADGQAEPPQ